MHMGTIKEWDEADKMLARVDATVGATGNSRLGELVMGWLREDLKERGPRSQGKHGTEGKTYGFGGIQLGGYGDESKQFKK
jgi:CCR4-NOT complex subunit CAF16